MTYVSSVERIGIEKGVQQGIQQGMQQGIQQGMQQGEALALQRLLTKRFGAVVPAVAAQIETADSPQISIWFDRAIDAASLDAVFADSPPAKR